MKHNSRSSSAKGEAAGSPPRLWRTRVRAAAASGLVLGTCLLLASGCESLQRKFTRKPKVAVAPPSPIIKFQDYTRVLTPIDRYRKHYLMFEYWTGELIRELGRQVGQEPTNLKRIQATSQESLAELEILHSLLNEQAAARMAPLLSARSKADAKLQVRLDAPRVRLMQGVLETHKRQIHRKFHWRKIEADLNPFAPSEPAGQGPGLHPGQPQAEVAPPAQTDAAPGADGGPSDAGGSDPDGQTGEL